MLTPATKICSSLFRFHEPFLQWSSIRFISSYQTLEESVRTAVEAKKYQQIPDLLIAQKSLAKTQTHSHSSPPSPSIWEPKSLMKSCNLLSLSDPVTAVMLPILSFSPTPSKALIPFPLLLPLFNELYVLAASLSPKLSFFFPMHGFIDDTNLSLS